MKKNFVLMILALILVMMPMTVMAAEVIAPLAAEEPAAETVEEEPVADEPAEETVEEEVVEAEEVVEVVEKTAAPSGEKVLLDGEEIKLDAYLIDAENYVKLRDIAALFKETKAKFAVVYNEDADTITITLGEAHEEDFVAPDEEAERAEKTGIPSYQKIFDQDEKEIELKGYLIEGNNYFRLRDLGEKLGFGVAYNFVTGEVLLDSENLEIEDVPHETEFATPINKVETEAGVQDIQFLIYGFEKCPHCVNLKKYLDENEIKYAMYDIRLNEQKKAEVYAAFYPEFNEGREKPYERVYYPTHVITLVKEDGTTISKGVLGFNQEKYEEIFKQIKANEYFK